MNICSYNCEKQNSSFFSANPTSLSNVPFSNTDARVIIQKMVDSSLENTGGKKNDKIKPQDTADRCFCESSPEFQTSVLKAAVCLARETQFVIN